MINVALAGICSPTYILDLRH